MKKTKTRSYKNKNKTLRSPSQYTKKAYFSTVRSNGNKMSYKRKGGMWPFTNNNKKDLNFDGIVPNAPSAPTTPVQKKMKYPEVSISYKNNRILCDVCNKDKFYKIDMSIPRSKVATGFAGIILGEGISDLIDHPVKCYLCTNCLHCRFVYANTTWNGTTQLIEESIYKEKENVAPPA